MYSRYRDRLIEAIYIIFNSDLSAYSKTIPWGVGAFDVINIRS